MGAASIQLARAMGADLVVDTARSDLAEALRAEIFAANDGRGVDMAIDSLGGEVTQAALGSLGWCGRLVVVGFAGGGLPMVKAAYLLVKHIAVIGLQWSGYRDRKPETIRAAEALTRQQDATPTRTPP